MRSWRLLVGRGEEVRVLRDVGDLQRRPLLGLKNFTAQGKIVAVWVSGSRLKEMFGLRLQGLNDRGSELTGFV